MRNFAPVEAVHDWSSFVGHASGLSFGASVRGVARVLLSMYICKVLPEPQSVVVLPGQGVLHLLDASFGLFVVSNESPIQHSTPYSTPM